MTRALWLVALLWLASGVAASTVHVRVHHYHHRHHREKGGLAHKMRTRGYGEAASGSASAATSSAQLHATCPASDSPLVGASTPVLTTACPGSCSSYNLCIYFPKAYRSQCTTTKRRTCVRGTACAFQCIPNADHLNGWFLSLYNDPAVVDSVNMWNTANPELRSVAVDISLVSQWLGRITLPKAMQLLYITGNEAANDFDPNGDTYYQDTVSLPKGAIIPFVLPPTLFEDVQSLSLLRLENIRAPTKLSVDAATLNFPSLEEMYLRNTMLTTIPLAHASFPSLTALDLSMNEIRDISRSALPDTLQLLNLSYNVIAEVKNGSLPENLQVLDLASNTFKQIPKGALPRGLQKLFLDGNSMTEIPPDVADMKDLNKLFLDGNPIKDIPENALSPTMMDSLSLINCSLTTVPRVIKQMTALTTLNIGSNDLSHDADFSVLPETMTLLNVDYAQLQKFPAALQSLPNLDTLSIAGNPKAVSDLSAAPPNLSGLYLEDNALDAVPTGVKDLSLVFIVLDSNPLGQLAPGSLPVVLEGLSMSKAVFTAIPAGTLPDSLTDLVISDSALQTAPEDIRMMRHLANVIITNCSLEVFDVANNLAELITMDLKHNRITKFSGRYSALTFLDLRGNGLREFNLSSAPLLETLHLAENNLTTFPAGVTDMNELMLLNLTGNPIRNFSPNVDQVSALSRISVIVLDQEMFAKDCDTSDQMDLRGYTICSPNSSNATYLKENGQHSSKMSAGLVLLNVCLAVALVLLVATAWRRRQLQKQRLRDLDLKTASLEKMQRHQSSASIWGDTVLVQNRLDEDLVVRKRLLGSGMYGEVWLAMYKNEKLALKQLKQAGETGVVIDRQLINDFVEEIKLLSSLTHPCVVRFVGVVWTKESDIAMMTEYMAGGDLRAYLDKNPKVDNGWTVQMARIALNITEAIVYLHSLDPIVIHRDLKSRNVLLDKSMRAKLSDFGISRYKLADETMTAAVGTVRWVAPEVLAGKRYDESVDIYSLGIILSEIDTHKLPFDDLTDESGVERLTDSAIAGLLLSGSLTSSFSESCPSEIRSLAERCTAFDPEERPSGLQVAYELRQMLKNSTSWISDSGRFHSSSNAGEDDAVMLSTKSVQSSDPGDNQSTRTAHISV